MRGRRSRPNLVRRTPPGRSYGGWQGYARGSSARTATCTPDCRLLVVRRRQSGWIEETDLESNVTLVTLIVNALFRFLFKKIQSESSTMSSIFKKKRFILQRASLHQIHEISYEIGMKRSGNCIN